MVSAVVDHSHLENDDVRNVQVLERFSFVEVPGGQVAGRGERGFRTTSPGSRAPGGGG